MAASGTPLRSRTASLSTWLCGSVATRAPVRSRLLGGGPIRKAEETTRASGQCTHPISRRLDRRGDVLPDLTAARCDLAVFAKVLGRPLTEWQADALRLDTRTTVLVAPRQT